MDESQHTDQKCTSNREKIKRTTEVKMDGHMFYCCFWGDITPPTNLLDSVHSMLFIFFYSKLVNNVVLFTRPDSSNQLVSGC